MVGILFVKPKWFGRPCEHEELWKPNDCMRDSVEDWYVEWT
jgi:hypothetical protein